MFLPMVILFTGKYFPEHILGMMLLHTVCFHCVHQNFHGNHDLPHVMPFVLVLFFFIPVLLVVVMVPIVVAKHVFI